MYDEILVIVIYVEYLAVISNDFDCYYLSTLLVKSYYILKYEGIVNVDSSIDLKYYEPIFR